MLCPMLALMVCHPFHLPTILPLSFQSSYHFLREVLIFLSQISVTCVPRPRFPIRQTKYVFCISGIRETESLLIFLNMLFDFFLIISKQSSWEKQDFLGISLHLHFYSVCFYFKLIMEGGHNLFGA